MSHESWMPRWSRLAILGGVVLLAAAVLLLKNRVADPPAGAASEDPATATLPEAVGQTRATAEEEQVGGGAAATAPPDGLPEAQLERLLTAGQPTLAFFHSDNCVQCIKMMQVVEQVYPEFASSVAMVDIDVYDQRNASLLQWAGIRAIPTQVFFDQAGQGLVVMGAMDSEQLRQQLRALAEVSGTCDENGSSGVCSP